MLSVYGPPVGTFGDGKRAESARRDLPAFVGKEERIGLVLLDEDQREQTPIEGLVIRVGPDSVIFRRDGLDEEIPLGIISRRLQGGAVVYYGQRLTREAEGA
jgi:hypothetical protein